MRRIKPVAPEHSMPLEGHLDELRSRLIVSIAVFGVALALCFWQNHLLLELAVGPLPSDHSRLITFGVTEPFTTTMTVAAYGAIILSLPILLYEIFAFFLTALAGLPPGLIGLVGPIVALIPVLFVAGVAFGYFVVMPGALLFLLNFNDSQFNVQLRARDYYGFFAMTLLACGVVFEVPVAILSATRLGITTVAEGVETRLQQRALSRMGCDVAQGYLVAKPMAASRVPSFLRTWAGFGGPRSAAQPRRLAAAGSP